MTNLDIRWIQRFQNYKKALSQLTKFIKKDELNELEEQGFVKSFEYTFELGWKVLKDLLEYQGFTEIIGSRDAIREAFKQNLLGERETDGTTWMGMIKSRNQTSHTYNEKILEELVEDLFQKYHPQFIALQNRLQPLADSELEK